MTPLSTRKRFPKLIFVAATLVFVSFPAFAQQPDGPQASPPPTAQPVQQAAPAPPVASGPRILVPAGTRFAVVLENGISTRGAKPGDSVYLRTSFPITQNNKVVVPVGSYLRGEITVNPSGPAGSRGRGEFRMKLNTLILPNGYTVDLNADPRSADSGGNETMDSEGKTTGGSGAGKDAKTIATTTRYRSRRPAPSQARRKRCRNRRRRRRRHRARRDAAHTRSRCPTSARLHARRRPRTAYVARQQSDSVQQRRHFVASHSTARPRSGKRVAAPGERKLRGSRINL